METQAFVRLSASVPLVPPPVRPLPLAVVTPVMVPVPLPVSTMSNSAVWLFVVFSLLSKLAFSGLLATKATPSLVWLPSSHAPTADVTSMTM